jgi:transcriptional regulator with XRE-family HTH domain
MPHHPVDVYVGARMRRRRVLLGMNQTDLGKAAGITFQQVQKYENGANRMGASRIVQFAGALGVPPSYFFEEMPEDILQPKGRGRPPKRTKDPLASRETMELVQVYHLIPSPAVRKQLRELARVIAATSGAIPQK